MKAYQVEVKIREHGKELIKEESFILILEKFGNINEFIQMKYGSWYDVIGFDFHQIKNVFIERGEWIEQCK